LARGEAVAGQQQSCRMYKGQVQARAAASLHACIEVRFTATISSAVVLEHARACNVVWQWVLTWFFILFILFYWFCWLPLG